MIPFIPCTPFKAVVSLVVFLFTALTFSSCTGIRTIPPAEFVAIDQSFKDTFTNKVCKFRGTTAKDNLLQVAEINELTEEKLSIAFDSTGRLKISSVSGEWSKDFDGKFKRGYYQVYLRRKRIEIPPVFPVFYSDVDVYRLRIAYHHYGYLLVENKYFRGKSILFLGGGRGQRNVYFFSKDKCD